MPEVSAPEARRCPQSSDRSPLHSAITKSKTSWGPQILVRKRDYAIIEVEHTDLRPCASGVLDSIMLKQQESRYKTTSKNRHHKIQVSQRLSRFQGGVVSAVCKYIPQLPYSNGILPSAMHSHNTPPRLKKWDLRTGKKKPSLGSRMQGNMGQHNPRERGNL